MSKNRINCALVSLGFALVAGISTSAQAAVSQYTIADWGTLPGFSDIDPQAISSNGHYLTGIGFPTGQAYPYYWNGPTPVLIPGANANGNANAVNSSGVAVGSSSYAFGRSGVQGDAWTYNGTTLVNLDPLLANNNNSTAGGINDSGVIIGSYGTGGGRQAFRYNGSTVSLLADMAGGSNDSPNAINSTGEIVGYSYDASTHSHAVIFHGVSPATDIGSVAGATDMTARAVSDNGYITGNATIGGNPVAYVYNGTGLTNLGTLGGSYSIGLGVNSAGLVVGTSRIAGGTPHGFVDDGTTMYDLNNLLSPPSAYNTWSTLLDATGITESGQIVGRGTWLNGETHAFVLTPVPEPTCLALLAGGAVLLMRRRANHRLCRRFQIVTTKSN